MTTPPSPRPKGFREPSDTILATQLRTLFHLHRAWGHDLRAPLNNLTLTSELMRAEIESDPDPAQLAARLKTIRESTERMTRLIESFLLVSAPPRDSIEHLELRALIRELESLLAPEARRRRIAITAHLPAEEVQLESIRDRLRQACLTVMAKVLESMPTGSGDLEITLSAQPSEIRIAAASRRPDPSTANPAAISSPGTQERESGITVEMARALIAALGGQLIEESTAGPELSLTILLPRT
jgi:signal transduction histidine kinase